MVDNTYPTSVSLPPVSQPLVDRATGLVTDPWYRYFEGMRERTGGDLDKVEAARSTASEASVGVNNIKETEIAVGPGLTGGGYLESNVSIGVKQQQGWVLSTGEPDNTTPYAAFEAPVFTTPPSASDAQGLADELARLSARYVALERAIADNDGIVALDTG